MVDDALNATSTIAEPGARVPKNRHSDPGHPVDPSCKKFITSCLTTNAYRVGS